MKEFTAGAAEFGEKMQMASTRTGMTVETLSVLHYAAALAHTDFDQLQGGVSKLAVNLESAAGGNKKMATAFQAAGIDAKTLAGESDGVDQAFKKLTVTLANTESASKRDALAKQLMGKAGVELVPVLMDVGARFGELSDGAEKAGVKMDALRAQRLAALDDELDKLQESIKGAGLAFTDGLAPGLIKVFDIISGGQSSENALQSWGENTAKIIARVAALFYDLAAAAEFGFSAVEGFGASKSGRKDLDSYEQLLKKGRELEELANGTRKAPEPKVTPKPVAGPGAGAIVDPSGIASANSIAEARAQLLDESARLELAKRKAADQVQLSEWEAQHKMLLVSDADFYAKKLELQNDELEAEQSALESKQQTLQALYEKQQALRKEGALKSKDGTSAEELKTQTELLKVQEQLTALDTKRAQLGAENTAETSAASQTAELARLKIAADLEKQRGQGTAAQIALLDHEAQLEMQRARAQGGSKADEDAVLANAAIAADKLRIEEVSRQIADTEADYRRKVDDSNDAVSKGTKSKRQAAQDAQQWNADEKRALQALVQQYQELANTLGGEYKQKAADLQEELSKLGREDRTHTFGYQLAQGMESTVESITQSAARGKQSVTEMAQSILDDVTGLLLKLSEQRFIEPLFENLFTGASGGAGTGAAAGKSGGSGSVLSSLGQVASGGFWKPPQRAASTGSGGATGVIADAAQAAKSSLMPKVTTNLQNNSSQPLNMGEPEISYDDKLGEFVVNYILNDHATGGQISQLYGRG